MTKKRSAKPKQTDTLNLRVDAKFDFGVWFAAEVLGSTKKSLVVSALRKVIDEARLPNGKSWTDFYDDSQAVTEIRLATDRDFPADAERHRLRAFVEAHAPFFFDDKRRKEISLARAEALWPRIGDYVATWQATKGTDYWAAGEAMAKDLKKARLAAPEWGEDVEL